MNTLFIKCIIDNNYQKFTKLIDNYNFDSIRSSKSVLMYCV